MSKIRGQYRQGDILLVRVDDGEPRGRPALKKQKPEKGRLILARGEATGHHHSVLAGAEGTSELLAGPNDDMYLLVQEGIALLEHQEHGTIKVDKGTYKVIRQRQYSPEMPQRQTFVTD